jgi:hypothetical protein
LQPIALAATTFMLSFPIALLHEGALFCAASVLMTLAA